MAGITWKTLKLPAVLVDKLKNEADRQSDEWGIVTASGLARDVLRSYLEGRKPDTLAPVKLTTAGIDQMDTSKGRLEDLARGNNNLRALAKASQKSLAGDEADIAYEEAAKEWREKFTHFCGEHGLVEETEGMDLVIEMENKLAARTAPL